MLSDIGLILADTSRSRAYLAALERHEILPSWVFLLDDGSIGRKQVKQIVKFWSVKNPISRIAGVKSGTTIDVEPWLDELSLNYQVSNSRDINSEKVIGLISQAVPSTFIYSGYGGVLLNKSLLACGKNFLHIHGGYLPDFRGSTTNYYSLLKDKSIGASSIFLTEKIDCGPILKRRKFPPPPNCEQIDHFYDSAARAFVLVETLKDFVKHGEWRYADTLNKGGGVFYIIHPVLKHLAILNATSMMNIQKNRVTYRDTSVMEYWANRWQQIPADNAKGNINKYPLKYALETITTKEVSFWRRVVVQEEFSDIFII